MDNDIQRAEKAYTTTEIATLLDMAISTVRKYAQHLERAGYVFTKKKGNARIFTENDIMVLRYLKELRDKTNVTVDQATSIVIGRFSKDSAQSAATEKESVIIKYEKQYKAMEGRLNEQAELIKMLSAKIKEAEKQNNERNDILIQLVKKLAGTMKLVLKDNKKKSWFSRLLNK